jgi:hypothetical protein
MFNFENQIEYSIVQPIEHSKSFMLLVCAQLSVKTNPCVDLNHSKCNIQCRGQSKICKNL